MRGSLGGYELDVGDLRIFRACVDEGSFAGAAAREGKFPQAVAKRIQRLEQDLSCTLFERTRGGAARPTTAGRALNEAIGNFLEETARVERKVANVAAARDQPIVVGVAPTISEFMLPTRLVGYSSASEVENPVSTQTMVANSNRVMEFVRERAVDFGLVVLPHHPDGQHGSGELAIDVFGRDEIVFAVPETAPAALSEIAVADLDHFEFLTRDVESSTWQVVNAGLHDYDVTLADPKFGVPDTWAVMATAEEIGVPVMITSLAVLETPHWRRIPVLDPDGAEVRFPRDFAVVTHGSETLSPAVQELIDYLTASS